MINAFAHSINGRPLSLSLSIYLFSVIKTETSEDA